MRGARRAAALAVLLGLGAAAPAGAVDGALYPYGPSLGWAYGGGTTAVENGGVFTIQSPATTPPAINHWEMNWGCPVAGSEVATVMFGALRTQRASSMAIAVTGDRRVLWAEGDAGMPQSPAAGRAYRIDLPGGQCNVHLALTQTESRPQHARAWFIDTPRILVRDVSPPWVLLRAVPAGWLGPGVGTARIQWTAADNFGPDGMGEHRVLVGGHPRWAGAAGAGDHAVDVPLDGLPDGGNRIRVEVDGDGTAAGASGEAVVHIDRTPPTATDLAATSGPQGATVRWSVRDPLSGPTASDAQVNAAGDGSTGGAWEPVAPADGPGPHAAAVPLGLADGVHAWRVVAADAAGNAGATAAADRVVIDTTPPELELHEVPSGWVRSLAIDLTASDNLQGALGLGATRVEVNAATDGGIDGSWLTRSSAVAAPGRRTVNVDLAGVGDGRHAVRVVVHNGGAFGDALTAERRATVRVDRTPPTLSRGSFTAGAGTVTASWLADDPLAGVESATLQWRDGAAWRTLAARPATDGPGSMRVDVDGLPSGTRLFRVLIADAAGNVAARQGEAQVSRGAGSTASDPVARLRRARLELAVGNARLRRIGGRPTLVARIRAGGPVVVTGRLRSAKGRAIGGAEIRAVGHRGATVGSALTRPDGRFRLVARPLAGGPLRVGVPAGQELLPYRSGPAVLVEAVPRVTLHASARSVAAGQQVVFGGRLSPAPRDIGLGSRKGVVLEWRDPVRGTWRPVVNARIRPGGAFAIPWSFTLSGLTIPMRVRVPVEVGWPLLQTRSGVIPVTVR